METKNLRNIDAVTGGLSYSVLIICYLISTVLFSAIINLSGLSGGTNVYLYLSYLVSPVAIILSCFITFGLRAYSFKSVLPYKTKPKYLGIALLIFFGMLFSLSWVNPVFLELFKLLGYTPREVSSYMPDVSGWNILPAILIIAVLPAVFEECFFRGLLLNTVKNSTGEWQAILLSGTCFSLYHGSPEQTVYQFICGCLFAWLAIKSKSLIPTVIIHFLNNAFIIVVYALNLVNESGDLIISGTLNTVFTCLSAVSLIVGCVLLFLDNGEKTERQKGQVKLFFIYASVGLAVMLLFWILAFMGIQ